MFWAQVMPFVVLKTYEGGNAEAITVFLICSFSAWALLNVFLFCSIDRNYVKTFFSLKTAAQYTCDQFLTSKMDSAKLDALFGNQRRFTRKVREEAKEWIAENITRWRAEPEDWFIIELIEDDLLPKPVYQAEGGRHRGRRSSVSVRSVLGLEDNLRVHPVTTNHPATTNHPSTTNYPATPNLERMEMAMDASGCGPPPDDDEEMY